MIARLDQIRRMMGALCVAMACLFCIQSTVVLFDRIEHGLELQHEPRALAGSLIQAMDNDDHAAQPDHASVHVHLDDVATMVLVPASPMIESMDSRQVAKAMPRSESAPTGDFTAPDRPPKA